VAIKSIQFKKGKGRKEGKRCPEWVCGTDVCMEESQNNCFSPVLSFSLQFSPLFEQGPYFRETNDPFSSKYT
jgi:hypothetical protein